MYFAQCNYCFSKFVSRLISNKNPIATIEIVRSYVYIKIGE